jgi:hypothetical protein
VIHTSTHGTVEASPQLFRRHAHTFAAIERGKSFERRAPEVREPRDLLVVAVSDGLLASRAEGSRGSLV